MDINASGMAKPMSDRDYFNLMTSNGEDAFMISIIVGYYPELERFVI